MTNSKHKVNKVGNFSQLQLKVPKMMKSPKINNTLMKSREIDQVEFDSLDFNSRRLLEDLVYSEETQGKNTVQPSLQTSKMKLQLNDESSVLLKEPTEA